MKLKKFKSQKNDDLSRKLKSYSALTGAFLVSAGAAQGQIVYTDVNPDTVIQGGQYDVDMDADGIIDFTFLQDGSSGSNGVAITADSAHLNNQVIATSPPGSTGGSGSYAYPNRLLAGAVIGPGAAFLSFTNFNFMTLAYVYATGGAIGNWNGQSGYVGVKFKKGANFYYGWIQCTVATGAVSLTIKGYAYESTPITAISAGNTVTGIADQPSTINKLGNFYPNPIKNGKTFIRLEAKELSDLKLEIINGMGQVMKNENRRLISGNNIIDLDVSSLASGTYFVKLTQGDHSFFRKLLISN